MAQEEILDVVKRTMEARGPSFGIIGSVSAVTLDNISSISSIVVSFITILVLIPSAIKAWKVMIDAFKKKQVKENGEK